MITGIVSVLMPYIRLVSIFKSLYLDSFSVTFTDVFLSDGTAMSMNSQVIIIIVIIIIITIYDDAMMTMTMMITKPRIRIPEANISRVSGFGFRVSRIAEFGFPYLGR